MSRDQGSPLGVVDGMAVVIGIVLGVGIFRVPGTVAALAGGEWQMFALWVAGALAALVGALCYAELASAWPSAGGEYHFLRKAYGAGVGLLFVWARATIIQTGAIAAVAFVFGDYARGLVDLPAWVLAALAVMTLTGINLSGWAPGRLTQRTLTLLTIAAMAGIVVLGLGSESVPPQAPATSSADGGSWGALGVAMVFVMLAYGGWNEAAYLGGDLRHPRRSMVKVLAGGLAVVALIYLLLNAAFLSVLGLGGMQDSEAVAAEALRVTMGEGGAVIVSIIIALAALSTLNATIITGSRAISALGRDVPKLHPLAGRRAALLAQGGWALVLVGGGNLARDGFTAMIEFTAPVFWLFLLMVGVSVFVLRRRSPDQHAPFRAPLYPLTPLAFCASSAFMLQASIAYVGLSGMVGIGLLAAGIPFCLWASRQVSPASVCAARTIDRGGREPSSRSRR